MFRIRLLAIVFIILGLGLGYFVYISEFDKESSLSGYAFKLGLDLKGGTSLTYRADTANISPSSVDESMSSLRDVIERRVNLFGVSEPVVQLEEGSLIAGTGRRDRRLIVELPGVTDVAQAVKTIGETPVLQFMTERDASSSEQILAAKKAFQDAIEKKLPLDSVQADISLAMQDPYFVPTNLTGSFLKKATLEYNQNVFTPAVLLEFNEEGSKMFAEITKANVKKRVAIYLDGAAITTPVVQEEIKDGKAQITGNFNSEEAKTLVGRLNAGALPVAIELVSTQKIGATLGEEALKKNVQAGVLGFLFVVVFLVLWYRLPGLLASLSLGIYVAIMLALFKFIPVTLTAAGIAGFILTIGMAVDANILIFERIKEELSAGRNLEDAIREGFWRAWESIRDSNLSTIITSIILFWFGTSLIRGFALTLAIGVAASMFTAITITRTILLSFGFKGKNRLLSFLFGHGFKL